MSLIQTRLMGEKSIITCRRYPGLALQDLEKNFSKICTQVANVSSIL